jgi:short-subunit dehydrogenase involved in D-alanine esterification of teichoic acids
LIIYDQILFSLGKSSIGNMILDENVSETSDNTVIGSTRENKLNEQILIDYQSIKLTVSDISDLNQGDHQIKSDS